MISNVDILMYVPVNETDINVLMSYYTWTRQGKYWNFQDIDPFYLTKRINCRHIHNVSQ